MKFIIPKIFVRAAVLTLPLLLAWCSGMAPLAGPTGGEYRSRGANRPAAEIEGAAGMADMGATRREADEEHSPQAPAEKELTKREPASRMVIYSAEYRLLVESVRQTVDRVKDMTARYGGFLESIRTSDSYMSASIVARVPASKFGDALDEAEKLGRVEHKTVSASDVTMQFSDVSLRIDTARKVRDRLYDLLRRVDKSREKVDILREIARLTTEIDNMTAERNYLSSRAAFSTLILDLRALVRDVTRRYIASPFGWIAALGHQRRSIVHDSDGDLVYENPAGFFDSKKSFFSARSYTQYLLANPENTVKMRLGVADNYPPADQKFWEEAVRLDFENRMYTVKSSDTIEGKAGLKFNRYLIALAGGDFYTVAFAVKGKKIIVFESHVKDETAFKEHAGTMERFVKSVGYDE